MLTSKYGLVFSYVALLVWHNAVCYSFPANIRHGYSSCQTCHVSPAGGGIVSKYGRMTAEEFMSTWSYEDQSLPLWGLYKLPKWLDVGGDIRYVMLDVESGGQKFELDFTMQADLELALHVNDKVSLVASAGQYGQAERWERRRYYGLFKLPLSSQVRVGRFYPVYGLMLDDHTKQFRRALGFDQGREQFNIEYSLSRPGGEFFVSRVFGNQVSFDGQRDGSIQVDTQDEQGVVFRGTKFFSKHFQLGLSYLRMKSEQTERDAVGMFGLWGQSKRVYHMIELDNQKVSAQGVFNIFFYRLGLLAFKGLHLKFEAQLTQSKSGDNQTLGGAIQWFPFPHLELLMQYEQRRVGEIDATSNLLMLHYYF